MASRRVDSNHIDAKKPVPSLATAAPLASGDQVDSINPLHATFGTNRRHHTKILLVVLAGALSLVLWSSTPSICGTWPAITIATRVQGLRETATALTQVFQIYPPVLTVSSDGSLELTDSSTNAIANVLHSSQPTCQTVLVEHTFASSYGQPYVGTYSPPPCHFNRVTFNLTVKSAGRQFDRLGSISFGDIELLRTSTAEPSKNGIQWTYLKDMSNFLPLFKTNQTIIFDLGNIVNDIYTASFNVTLTAAFFTAHDTSAAADMIFPISQRQGAAGQPSFFQYPREKALDEFAIPQNIARAVVSVAATGQADEEFWWGNVPQSVTDTFPGLGSLLGFSPFREVQLYIDDLLAGVVWPFPVIFTGGVVPGLWRPLVGIDAFDLKEDEIDVTPWLGVLCDGRSHKFEIRVSGLSDTASGAASPSNTTGDNWWLTGKIFLWLDTPGHATTSSQVQHLLPKPEYLVESQVYQSSHGSNETLIYDVAARRYLHVSSQINLANGTITASWTQQLNYSNSGNYTSAGDQTNTVRTMGQDASSSGYQKSFVYPLYSHSTQSTSTGNLTLTASVSRGKTVQILGQAVFPTGLESFSDLRALHAEHDMFGGALLHTLQNGSAFYTANHTEHSSYSYGTTEQELSFFGLTKGIAPQVHSTAKFTQAQELYHRHVKAVNDSVVHDEESLLDTGIAHRSSEPGDGGSGMALSGNPGRGARTRG